MFLSCQRRSTRFLALLSFLAQRGVSFSPPFTTSYQRAASQQKDALILTGRNNIRTAATNNQLNEGNEDPTRVCIIGGGFGGLNAAFSLSSLCQRQTSEQSPSKNKKNKNVEIVLLDPKDRFVFLPLLYELAVGDATLEEVAPTYETLLEENEIHNENELESSDSGKIKFVQGCVEGIDVAHQCLYLNDLKSNTQQKLNYDALIVASGNSAAYSSSNALLPPVSRGKGKGEESISVPVLTFQTVEDGLALNEILQRYEQDPRRPPTKVVVVGGGYAGVEVALNLADQFQISNTGNTVTLIHRGSDILPNSSEYNKRSAKERLGEAGVRLLTDTSVLKIQEKKESFSQSPSHSLTRAAKVHLQTATRTEEASKGYTLDANLVLWTVSSQPNNPETQSPEGVLNSPLLRDSVGRLVTTPTLRVRGTTNVFAIGDAARVTSSKKGPDGGYVANAQVAIQQASVAAYNVLTTIENQDAQGSYNSKQKLLPFRFVDLGEMLSLGKDDATVQSLGGLVQLKGPAASLMRRVVYGVRMPAKSTGVKVRGMTNAAFSRVRGEKRRGK